MYVSILFDESVGYELLKDINLEDFIFPQDFHVTCLYIQIDDPDLEIKQEILEQYEQLEGEAIDVTFDSIYKTNGNIFAKTSEVSFTLPRMADQILHMTLAYDYSNGYTPKDSLTALQNETMTKIKDINLKYTGQININRHI